MPIEIRDLDNGGRNIIIGRGVLTREEYLGMLKNISHKTKINSKNINTASLI
jgi:hypothetical protein